MLIARGDNGKDDILLLGLSRGNIERLTDGQPIRLSRETHGDGIPEGLEILILFGETEQAIAADLKKIGVIGGHTKTTVDPRLNDDK